MKRANRHGTVYKLKGNRRNPWVAKLFHSLVKGHSTYKIIGYYPTKADAELALSHAQIKPLSPKDSYTLNQLFEEWKVNAFKDLTKSTKDNYKAAWNHLEPLHDEKFSSLRSENYNNLIRKIELSRSSHAKIKTLLVMLSDYAREHDIITTNYASLIKLPKKEPAKKEPFTDQEIKILKKNINQKWVPSILILIYTGLRIGELLSLKPADLNLEKNYLIGGSKTAAGMNRIVPIHPLIKKHLIEFVNDKEVPRDDDNFRKRCYFPALEKLNLPRKTPHQCRHTFGTLLAAKGVSTVTIKALMGHTNYSFTADRYTHPQLENLSQGIKSL